MEIFNKKSFGSLKRSIKKSGESLQKNVQRIIEQGLSHYLEEGDTVYLNQAMAVAIATKTIRTVAMQEYIQKAGNVYWTEVKVKKEGKIRVFKKSLNEDGTKPDATVDTAFVASTTWYDYSKLGTDAPDMDFNAQLKSLITRTKSAIASGAITDKDGATLALVELEKLAA